MTKPNAGKRKERPGYIVDDVLMIILLLINLLFISFDWLFQSAQFREWVEFISPAFKAFYADQIHDDFILYDLIFVAIFLAEFFVRWVVSIKNKDFSKWYYFPFVYWYDLVGCIPIGGFRFLRLLRLVTIAVRLQRMEKIDMTKLALYRFLMHYFNVFIQEITDRVTLTILSNVREELHEGTPVIDGIVDDVLRPRQAELINWISMRLQLAASKGYALHEEEIRVYVQQRINQAVDKNKELRNLESVPLMGRVIVKQIEGAISDIVFSVVHGIIRDLGSSKNRALIEDVSELLLEDDNENGSDQIRILNLQVADILSESVGIVMERVKERKWNPREIAEAEERLEENLRESARNP